MRASLESGLLGVSARPSAFGRVQRNIGIAKHHVDETEPTGGGVSTKTEIPDQFGLRVKYANDPSAIGCLNIIWQAVQEFNLNDGKEPLDLRKADLSALSRLTDEDDYFVNLERYILSLGAKRQYPLNRARLFEARLDGAILDGARLDGAILFGASLVGASLRGARLDGAILDGVILVGARLDGANLTRANLKDAHAYVLGKRLMGEELKNYLKLTFSGIKNLDGAMFV